MTRNILKEIRSDMPSIKDEEVLGMFDTVRLRTNCGLVNRTAHLTVYIPLKAIQVTHFCSFCSWLSGLLSVIVQ